MTKVLKLSDGTNDVSIECAAGEHRVGVAYGSSLMRLSVDDSNTRMYWEGNQVP